MYIVYITDIYITLFTHCLRYPSPTCLRFSFSLLVCKDKYTYVYKAYICIKDNNYNIVLYIYTILLTFSYDQGFAVKSNCFHCQNSVLRRPSVN